MQTIYRLFLKIILVGMALISAANPARAESSMLQRTPLTDAHALAVEGEYVYIAGDASALAGRLPEGSLDQGGGLKDVWLVKMRTDGTVIYQALVGGSNDDNAYGLAVQEGVVYILGETWSSDFPGAPGNAGENDAVIMALAADGSQVLWSRRLGGSDQDSGRALVLLGDRLFLTGITWSQDFNPGAARGDADGFLASLDLSGATDWLQVFGGSGLDAPNALAAAPGQIWVAGQTFSPNFGGAARGGGDAFAVRFDLDGSQQFTGLYGGREEEMAFGIALNPGGGVYLTGGTQSGSLAGATGKFGGGFDAFVMKIGSDGALQKTTYLGGAGAETAHSILALPDESALVAGRTNSPEFPLGHSLAAGSLGGEDAFMVQLNPAGEPVSVWRKGSSGDDRASRLGITSNGVWLAGKFSTGSLSYAMLVPPEELAGITLPAVSTPQPTATMAATATPWPTETPGPTATEILITEAAPAEPTPTLSSVIIGTPDAIEPSLTNPGPAPTHTGSASVSATQPSEIAATPGITVLQENKTPAGLFVGVGLVFAAVLGAVYWFIRKKS